MKIESSQVYLNSSRSQTEIRSELRSVEVDVLTAEEQQLAEQNTTPAILTNEFGLVRFSTPFQISQASVSVDLHTRRQDDMQFSSTSVISGKAI